MWLFVPCLSLSFWWKNMAFSRNLFKEFLKTDVKRYYLPDGRKLETDSSYFLIKSQSVLWTDVINTKRSRTKQLCFVLLLLCVSWKLWKSFHCDFYRRLWESVSQTLFLSGYFFDVCFWNSTKRFQSETCHCSFHQKLKASFGTNSQINILWTGF